MSGPDIERSGTQATIVRRQLTRYRDQRSDTVDDDVTVEEPLEIRLHGEAMAVVMRTPGNDFELVAGFLLTEGVIGSAQDLGAISHCGSGTPPNEENVVDVRLADGVEFDMGQLKRNLYASSSCGVCGKANIDSIRLQAPPLDANFEVSTKVLYALDESLRGAQSVFERTGSLHAAGLFDVAGKLLVLREDIGRHNAVDKVVGSFLVADGEPPRESILMVSGRSSFEIIQKALMAGIPMVTAVSAPSSLAVDLALETDMTLVGFLRGRGFNIYAGEKRIIQ